MSLTKVAKQDSTQGPMALRSQVFISEASENTFAVTVSADSDPVIKIELLSPDGNPIAIMNGTPIGSLEIKYSDLRGKEIRVRETRGCDPLTNQPRYCMMLRSEWYSAPLTTTHDT